MVRNTTRWLCLFAVAAGITGSAHAQATRTWVSGVGDDANPCSRTAPCKTFAGAISKTAAGGEISALDPGGFGAVTITKSITINGDGTLASILASGTNGVVINAGTLDRIVLRNLSINGAGTGINGIRLLAAGRLVVENVTIAGFTTRGVDVATSAATNVLLHDVTFSSVHTGVRVSTTAGTAAVTLDGVSAHALINGLDVASGGFVAVRNSSFIRNSTGVLVSGAGATANVERSTIAFNTTGINASAAGAVVRLADNGIYNNGTGIAFAGGATVASAQDNRVSGNGASAAPNAVIVLE
jgi:hypothetical protein